MPNYTRAQIYQHTFSLISLLFLQPLSDSAYQKLSISLPSPPHLSLPLILLTFSLYLQSSQQFWKRKPKILIRSDGNTYLADFRKDRVSPLIGNSFLNCKMLCTYKYYCMRSSRSSRSSNIPDTRSKPIRDTNLPNHVWLIFEVSGRKFICMRMRFT